MKSAAGSIRLEPGILIIARAGITWSTIHCAIIGLIAQLLVAETASP